MPARSKAGSGNRKGLLKRITKWFVDWLLRPALRTQTLFLGWVVLGLIYYMGVQGRSVEEALYVMVQIITTVGYGDVTVKDDTSRWLSAAYVLVAVLVLSSLVGEYSDSLVQSQSKIVKSGIESVLKAVAQDDEDSPLIRSRTSSQLGGVVKWYLQNKEIRAFVRSVIIWNFMILLGCLFFCNYPGEEKNLAEAFYMSVITLTTVGFGDITPKTPMGKWFATVWMLVGCAAFVDMAGNFSKLTMSLSARKLELTRDSLRRMFDSYHIKTSQNDRCRRFQKLMEEQLSSHAGIDEQIKKELISRETVHEAVGRSDFILHCLLDMGIVGQDLIEQMSADFDILDRDGSGYLDEKDLSDADVKQHVRSELSRRAARESEASCRSPRDEPLLGPGGRRSQC